MVVGGHYAAGQQTRYDRWSKARVEVLSLEKRDRIVQDRDWWHSMEHQGLHAVQLWKKDDGIEVKVIEAGAFARCAAGLMKAGSTLVIPLSYILEPWEEYEPKRDEFLAEKAESARQREDRESRISAVIIDLAARGIKAEHRPGGIDMSLEQAELLLERMDEIRVNDKRQAVQAIADSLRERAIGFLRAEEKA